MSLRRYQWDLTARIHSVAILTNSLEWGRLSNSLGYVNVYPETIRLDQQSNYQGAPDYDLDYPPLRLLTFAVWAKWLDCYHPGAQWLPSYEINEPLLLFNTCMEIAAAVAVFMLVNRWLRSAGQKHATSLALGAAIFLWLNPAMIINSWGRLGSEVWILPFYLFAVLMAFEDCWLSSGLIFGIGIMFKGQMLAVAPMFLLWPTFAGRVNATIRWIAGFAIGTASIVAPWMITRPVAINAEIKRVLDYPAIIWICCIILWTLMLFLRRRTRLGGHSRSVDLLGVVLGIALSWPALMLSATAFIYSLTLLCIALIFLRWLPQRYLPATALAVIAGAIFACVPLFQGSMDWFRVVFVYGVKKHPQLAYEYASNLAGILQDRYDYASSDRAWTVPQRFFGLWPAVPTIVSIKVALLAIYCVALIICSFAVAYLYRRHHPRFLIAIITPWLLFFALGPQLHGRYLLWAAGVGSIALGVDVGSSLLVALLSFVSWLMTIGWMLHGANPADFAPNFAPSLGESLFRFVAGAYPDLGWIVVLLAAIFLYKSIAPTPKTLT